MPIIKSAIKQMRQNEKRRAQNVSRKRQMSVAIKQTVILIKERKGAEAAASLPKTYKAIDLATKHYLMHKNRAARKKSQLAKAVAQIGK